jgi:hypothetical protein
MDEYLNQSKNTPDELLKLFHKVGSFELCFESHVMTNSVLTEEAKKNLHSVFKTNEIKNRRHYANKRN